MNQIQAFLLALTCLVSMTASAQWQWLDKDGRKVFSDRAPPPEVLDKNILQRPASKNAASAAVAPALQGEASAPRPSGIDKDLAEKKAKADQAESARRKADQEKALKAKAENCTRARQARATYDSVQRIAQTNEKGEREIMSEASRAAEIQRIDAIIETDCK